MEYVTLNNDVKMPVLGYGVYQVTLEECEQCVADAIRVGYRSIDTAQAYANEEGVGNAIAKCGVPREEFFITTKVWITNAGYKEGKVRAIGVSNFYPDRYIDIAHFAEVKPAINQVETHVFQQQKLAKEYMKKYGTQIESWGPFAEGKNDMFTNPVLMENGGKYGKSVAQTALRFLIQSGVVVIPKSVHKERMEENINVFDFQLTEAEMQRIESPDGGESLFFSHYDPKTVEWIVSLE